jgi:hypothetical protein
MRNQYKDDISTIIPEVEFTVLKLITSIQFGNQIFKEEK